MSSQKLSSNAPTVRIETVGTLAASQPKSYPGIVAAKEAVEIVARVSGFLKKVAFREGSVVKKGDLLFEIEDTIYAVNVNAAKAVVRQFEAEIELAQRDLERIQTLRAQRVVTEQELDQAIRNRDLQQAKLDEANANLALAINDLSYTKIYAPLTGRIGAKQFSEGNYITPTSGVLASIVQYDPISVKVTLSEMDFARYFQDGNEENAAKIDILRADGHPYKGVFNIDFFDNLVDRRTGTITTYLICENADAQLLPGGYAKIKLAERFTNPLPAVSVASIMSDGAANYVYVLTTDNKIERRNVTLGVQVFDRYAVTSGLVPGEKIVAGGANKVSPGMEVNPVKVKDIETDMQAQK